MGYDTNLGESNPFFASKKKTQKNNKATGISESL